MANPSSKVKEVPEEYRFPNSIQVRGALKIPSNRGLTASAVQTQVGATALIPGPNIVTTCATAGNAVRLPLLNTDDDLGTMCIVANLGVATCQVFPGTSATIKGGAANAVDAVQIAANGARTYILNKIGAVYNWDPIGF